MSNRCCAYIKKSIVCSVVLLVTAGYAAAAGAEENADAIREEVRGALSRLARAYQSRDIDALMDLYGYGPEVSAVMTGQECVGRDQIRAAYKKDFASMSEVNPVQYFMLSLQRSGGTAWLTADGFTSVVKNGRQLSVYGRLSAVLQKKGPAWKFMQTHFSYPVTDLPGSYEQP